MSNQHNNDGPLFWYRPCSNGLYEGPLHDKTIEDVRKRSGAWVPLYPHPPAAAPAPASSQDEPFGYFRAEPFGWTECAETDEGAIALYERPAAPAVPQGEPVAWMVWAGILDMRPVMTLFATKELAEAHARQIKSKTEVRPVPATPATPSQPVTCGLCLS